MKQALNATAPGTIVGSMTVSGCEGKNLCPLVRGHNTTINIPFTPSEF